MNDEMAAGPARRTSEGRVEMQVEVHHQTFRISGHVSAGYHAVLDRFIENFTKRHELGGACCAFVGGEKIVDLWGGIRDRSTGDPWEKDTMVLVHSTTKGLAAMTLALAHSRGWLDYEEPVSRYWPEFAQHGKERITVRQLLAHQAGLFALDEPLDLALVGDPDRLAVVLARQKPAWEPGTRQAYHAITLGFYEGELLRRIDPAHRTLGRFFDEEIAGPLGLDVYIRLPHTISNERLAPLVRPPVREIVRGFPFRFTLDVINPHSNIARALVGSNLPVDEHRVYARELEIPSGGGVGTARGIAQAYSVFATDGRALRLAPDTLRLLAAPAIPATHGFHDECMKADGIRFSLGFMKPTRVWPFGSEASFGAPGAGGSIGFADPIARVAYSYVTCRMGTCLTGDPRDVALRDALYGVVDPRIG